MEDSQSSTIGTMWSTMFLLKWVLLMCEQWFSGSKWQPALQGHSLTSPWTVSGSYFIHWACPSLLLSAFSLVSRRWVPPHNSIFWVILILQGSAKQQFIRLQSIPAFISHVHLRNCKETEAALLFIYWCEHNNHSWTKLNLLLEGAQRLSEDSKFSPQTCKLKLRRAVMPLQTFTHLLKQLNLTYKKSNTWQNQFWVL